MIRIFDDDFLGGDGKGIGRGGRIGRREEVVERIKRVEQRDGCSGRDDPVWSCVFEVLQDDVDADVGALPAEAVEEVGRHFGGQLSS